MRRVIFLGIAVGALILVVAIAWAQQPATSAASEPEAGQGQRGPGGDMMGGGMGMMHGGRMMHGGGMGPGEGMHGAGMMGGPGAMHGRGMGMGRGGEMGGDMCGMMMGGDMGMMGASDDPRAAARTLRLRGDMLKAMGEVLLKHGAELEKAAP